MIPTGPPRATELSVFDSFERLGVWTLPGRSSQLCGKIEYDPARRMSLTVVDLDPMTSSQSGVGGTTEKLFDVRGVLETGEHVLLDECFARVEQIYANSRRADATTDGVEIPGGTTLVGNLTYTVKQAYVSSLPVPPRPKFSKMSVSYTSLFAWLTPRFVHTAFNQDRSMTIRFTPPEYHTMSLPDNLSMTISHSYSISTGASQQEFRLPQHVSIIFEMPYPVSVDQFYSRIYTFANFLMMATKEPVQPKSFRATYSNDSVTVFPSYNTRANLTQNDNTDNMYFNYLEIASTFDRSIQSWFSMYKKYSKSMDIYFQTRLDDLTLPTDTKFIRLVYGLEAFHRAKYPKGHPNCRRPSLAKRLKKLVCDLDYTIFDKNSSMSDFLSTVSTARNYISHGFIQDTESKMPDQQKLYMTTQRAELLLYGCYLNELNIDAKLKHSIMNKKLSYIHKFKFL